MEALPVLLAFCEGNPSVTDVYLHKDAVMLSFDVILAVSLNKQSDCKWFETPWHSCDVTVMIQPQPWVLMLVTGRFEIVDAKCKGMFYRCVIRIHNELTLSTKLFIKVG